jgi:demethylmenaquinone methyltransferase/2-methoxy-6-polyprenyl-1,4-benzoquinol methylase
MASTSPGALDEPQVRAMFDRIAGLYDRMNSVMTAGLHHEWRRRAADLAELSSGDRALDVATGTGDLALELATRVGASGEVIGVDFSERMLELARAKAAASPGAAVVRFETGNALALEYPDDGFDAATVGFGARIVVLEITTPRRPPLSTFFDVWFDHMVPALGRVVDSQAYSYLPSSVKRFPGPEELAAVMWRSGLRQIRYVLTAGGIIALHVGLVPT